MTRKVLIIEDDELLNRLIVRCISQLGHDVTGTRSWNAVERAIILSRDRPHIGIAHLAFLGRRNCPEISTQLSFERDPTLEELEARYLALQLKKFSGHRGKVVEVLGISERNLYRLIKRYGLTQPQAGH